MEWPLYANGGLAKTNPPQTNSPNNLYCDKVRVTELGIYVDLFVFLEIANKRR